MALLGSPSEVSCKTRNLKMLGCPRPDLYF
jgi:hypothetical protein